MAAFVPAVGAQEWSRTLGQIDSGEVVGIVVVAVLLSSVPVFVGCFLALMLRDAIRGTGKAATRAVQRDAARAAAQRDPARASSASVSPSPAADDGGSTAKRPPSGTDAAELAKKRASALAKRALEAITVADSNGQVWEADLRDAALRWAEAEGLADGDRSLLTRAWLASAARSSGAVRTDAWHARRGRRYDGLRLREVYDGGD